MVRQIRWLGPENCEAVFAILNLDHPSPDEELDHTRIRGLGPDGDQTAYWGDLIEVEDSGISHVAAESTVSISRAALDELYAEVEEARRELNPLRDLAPSEEQRRDLGDDDEFFVPGRTYISANGWFQFTCQAVVAGVALGFEDCLRGPAVPRSRRVWMSVKPAGCWTEAVAEAEK